MSAHHLPAGRAAASSKGPPAAPKVLRAAELKQHSGRLDAEQIGDAIEALIKRDAALAKRVIAQDDRVDDLQREIEEKAFATIARRQPMACDLREIVGALRISNDLERVGDLAENIAKRVLLLAEERRVDKVVLQLRHMVDLVRDRLTGVLQSYEHRDVTPALDIWRKDQEIDALNTGLFRELLTFMMEDPRSITFCTHMLFCALEDHEFFGAIGAYYADFSQIADAEVIKLLKRFPVAKSIRAKQPAA